MIRFGIVGAGNIARKFAEDINVVKGAKAVAIASRSRNRATAFKNDFDLDYAFDSYQEMVNSKVIDAVYIATTHNFHKEHALLFLHNRIPVLCEKPITVNTRELNELIQVAQEKQTLFMEAMWTRFLPATRYLMDIVSSNTFGKITKMKLSFGFDIATDAPIEGRLLNPNLAGGSLLDVGIYPVSYMHLLKGTKFKIDSSIAEFHTSGVDLNNKTLVTYDDGVKVELQSAINRWMDNKATITFEKGEIIIPDFWSSTRLILNGEEMLFPHQAGGFEYQIIGFCETLQKQKLENDIMSHQHSRDVMKTMDEIRERINLKYPFEK